MLVDIVILQWVLELAPNVDWLQYPDLSMSVDDCLMNE